jgi:hypothetical protein
MYTDRFGFSNVTGSVLVNSGRTHFHGFVVNTVNTVGTVTIYDSLTASGTVIAGPVALASGSAAFPSSLTYDAYCNTGLYFNFTGFVGNVTVLYKQIA